MRAYSRLGEHAVGWIALGVAGATYDPHRRAPYWVRATAAVGIAYWISTSIKVAIGRRRPMVEDLPHLMATPTGLSFPSSHSTSSFAAARAYGPLLPSGPLYGAAAGDGALAALPRRALPVRHRGRGGARRTALGSAVRR